MNQSKSLARNARWVTGDPLKLDPFPTKDVFDEEDLPSLPRNPGAKLFILIISGTSTHETEAQANKGEAAYFCVNACTRAQQPEILSVWPFGGAAPNSMPWTKRAGKSTRRWTKDARLPPPP